MPRAHLLLLHAPLEVSVLQLVREPAEVRCHPVVCARMSGAVSGVFGQCAQRLVGVQIVWELMSALVIASPFASRVSSGGGMKGDCMTAADRAVCAAPLTAERGAKPPCT